MPQKEIISKYNHGEKSMKAPYIIYADMESLINKIYTCHNNPEKSATTKKNKSTTSGYSLYTHCPFDTSKNKLDYYRDNDCMKTFFIKKDLREHATKIISYEKKRNDTINKYHENQSYHEQKVCYICREEFTTDDKKYYKVRDHCHYSGRGAAHDICNLRYKTSKEIPVIFHYGSSYDYHFIIKELAEEFEGQFKCLGENT